MSAFVVSKAHIDALVTLALKGPNDGDTTIYGSPWYGPHLADEPAKIEDADHIGRALWAQNIRSVRYRYPDVDDAYDNMPGPVDLTPTDVLEYRWPMFGRPAVSVAQGLKAIHCYEYQSCEDPGWEESPERAFVRELADCLTRYVPGYAEADWEIKG